MRKRAIAFVVLSALVAAAAFGQDAGTIHKRVLTGGWQFIRQDLAGVWEAVRPVVAGKPESVPLWQEVTLPHCFNAFDAVDPYRNYYQGAGWYRTELAIDNRRADGRVLLHFAGAGQKTDVYVYTRKVGSHVGGYDGWTVDMTDAVREFAATEVCRERYGGRVPVVVRCDNGRDTEMIPSDMSDFNLYGGLYREVTLEYVPATYISHMRVDAAGRKVAVSAEIGGSCEGATLSLVVKDPQGNVVARKTEALQESDARMDVEVRKPVVWDVDAPRLYTCELTVGNKGEEHRMERRFGFRSYEFKEHGPFVLNGRRLLLQGTHRHEDHAGVGAAMTDGQIVAEMCQIKEMGANFIRLGHYQQSERVLQLCDSLGILAWEEIPWCRGGLGGEKYREQARRMLRNMIRQHAHHPSVVLWGLGNENDWPGDFEHFDKDSIRAFMSELNDIAHHEDPLRKTSIRRCDFCSDVVDVYSPSIWAGWYSRSFRDFSEMVGEAIRKFPRFFHAEWGGDSHARRHSERDYREMTQADKNGDWTETYIVRLFDWCLKEQLQMPNLTGGAFWTFKDFSTPLRPDNPVPYVNQKGVVERDGTPKESYYVFQSYWTKKPMLHIYGHTWPVRWGRPGEEKEILVYSNCKEVELFVNGKSQGVRKRDVRDYPACGLHWNVVLNEGGNSIRAVAKGTTGMLTDEIRQEYQTAPWGEPAAIEAKVVRDEAQDCSRIDVQLVDKNGVRCLDAANWLTFELAGDGTLIADMGTATASRRVQAYNGRGSIRVRHQGKAVVAVKSPGIPTRMVTIDR